MGNDARYQAVTEALRRHVCSVCLDGTGDGRCGLTERTCALESHLPQLVDAIVSVRSNDIADYERAVRAHVCASCAMQDVTGHCGLRERGDCALDAYLSLVLDAIEETLIAPPPA